MNKKFRNIKSGKNIALVVFLLATITFSLFVSLRQISNSRDIRSRAVENPAFSRPTKDNLWGRIANQELEGDKIRGVFFFAGPPNDFSRVFYTRHPIDSQRFEWKIDDDVRYILKQIKSVRANVIKLSWWGNNDEYIRWAPTINTKEVNSQTFRIAGEQGLMVAPVIEVSEAFRFWEEFPDNTLNMETRIRQVLQDYGAYSNWLSVYDKSGQKRKAIFLIETIHASPIDPVVFAQAFDMVADKIKQQTGELIGFIIDPTPLPPSGSYYGPEPEALKNTQSILAINPFNLTSDGNTEAERLAEAEEVCLKWKNSGLPFIPSAVPGYDDHIVRPPGQKYGDNAFWRTKILQMMVKNATAGVTLDVWNGFTEGYAFAPTEETKDLDYQLAQRIFFTQLR